MLSPIPTNSLPFLRRHGSLILTFILIGLTIASPLADSSPAIGIILAAVVVSLFITGAAIYRNHKIMVRILLPLCCLWFVFHALQVYTSNHYFFSFLAHATGLTLSCITVAVQFRRLGSDTSAPVSVLAGAFNIYLIIAIAFSQIFWILNNEVPNAFNRYIPPEHNTDILYFSMVTITALGYGVIAPIDPFVRVVAALEGMVGIFYIAVVVARVVASFHPFLNQVSTVTEEYREVVSTETLRYR